MAASIKGKPGKPIIKADTSYKSISVPELSKEENEIVVGLLSSLLEPIGRHRVAHTVKSAGKKSKKRKRSSGQLPAVDSRSLEPDVLDFLTVGLNSTTRHLEARAALSRPESLTGAEDSVKGAQQDHGKHLAAVLITKPKDDMMYAHLPVLCYTTSLGSEGKNPTRLVLLDASSERTIAASMGLSRAGVIGVMENAPGAAPLLDYISNNVAPVEVPWLKDALAGRWMGVSVESRVPGRA